MKEDFIIDSALSVTSTHPVENRVVTKALANKLNVEEGKGLSTNDFTNDDKTKLDSIEKKAQVNVIEKIVVNGEEQEIKDKTVEIEVSSSGGGEVVFDYDSLPVGAIVDFEGDTVPAGYEEVEEEEDTDDAPTNAYSTSEQVIGTWIDGKPLYRKTLMLSNPTLQADSSVGTGLTNVKRVVNMYGVTYNGTYSVPIVFYNSLATAYIQWVYYRYSDSALMYHFYWGTEAYITLEYTKTTD